MDARWRCQRCFGISIPKPSVRRLPCFGAGKARLFKKPRATGVGRARLLPSLVPTKGERFGGSLTLPLSDCLNTPGRRAPKPGRDQEFAIECGLFAAFFCCLSRRFSLMSFFGAFNSRFGDFSPTAKILLPDGMAFLQNPTRKWRKPSLLFLWLHTRLLSRCCQGGSSDV